jgi:hypothetical protein
VAISSCGFSVRSSTDWEITCRQIGHLVQYGDTGGYQQRSAICSSSLQSFQCINLILQWRCRIIQHYLIKFWLYLKKYRCILDMFLYIWPGVTNSLSTSVIMDQKTPRWRPCIGFISKHASSLRPKIVEINFVYVCVCVCVFVCVWCVCVGCVCMCVCVCVWCVCVCGVCVVCVYFKDHFKRKAWTSFTVNTKYSSSWILLV